jgi:hypothetical protein
MRRVDLSEEVLLRLLVGQGTWEFKVVSSAHYRLPAPGSGGLMQPVIACNPRRHVVEEH